MKMIVVTSVSDGGFIGFGVVDVPEPVKETDRMFVGEGTSFVGSFKEIASANGFSVPEMADREPVAV